jgi:hypothetical protein
VAAKNSPLKRRATAKALPTDGSSNASEDEFTVLNAGWKRAGLVTGLLLALAACSYAAEKIVWKPIADAILQVDARAIKIWNLFQAGKKLDPLLLQLGARSLVIYVRNQQVYEIKTEQLEHKGEDLVWHDSDKPSKPLATLDWSAKDIGSAWRVRFKLADEGRLVDIQIPQIPDLRRGIY